MSFIGEDGYTNNEYFLCSRCHHVNAFEHHKKEKKEYNALYSSRNTWRKFRVLSAERDLSAEETLLYLMHLADREKEGKMSTVNVSVSNEETRRR